ncbi:MAG: RNase H family protein [Arcobacter sp.]
MKNIKLFTDSSVNPQEKIGFGSFLIIEDEKMTFENLKKTIKTKKFENTSSTKLELQTLLWALAEIKNKNSLIEIYTDCQNIIN